MKGKRTDHAIIELLDRVNQNLEKLGEKLDRIVELQETAIQGSRRQEDAVSPEGLPLDVATLLSLPDHLRKTAMAICTLGEATAEEVASNTGRVRAAESDYLNQLVAMGHLKKRRKGRDVHFYIERT